MQMYVFAQEAFAHLPHQSWLFDSQHLGAQKQKVNRRVKMPAIFQKLNGQSLWTASRKDNRKRRGKDEEKWKCTEKLLTTIQIRQVERPPLPRAEAMANWKQGKKRMYYK